MTNSHFAAKASTLALSILGLAMSSLATPVFYEDFPQIPEYYRSMANPIYYQFKGVVTESNVADRAVGSEVRYVFVMDFQRLGLTVTVNNVQYPEFWQRGTFYMPAGGTFTSTGDVLARDWAAEFAGGDVLPVSQTNEKHSGGHFFAYDYLQYGRINSGISTDYGDPLNKGRVSVRNTGSHALDRKFIPDGIDTARVPLWHVGQSDFFGTNANGGGDIVKTRLTLWSISMDNPVPAVPEPSTVALMGLGLVGVFAAHRKSKKT